MYALYQQVRLADKVIYRLFQQFDALLSNQCLTPQDLLAAIVEARERHRPVETVLIERYQVSKQEIGYAPSALSTSALLLNTTTSGSSCQPCSKVSIQAISKRITGAAAG